MIPEASQNRRRLVAEYVHHYNHARLHSALGCITPADHLAGRASAIHPHGAAGLRER